MYKSCVRELTTIRMQPLLLGLQAVRGRLHLLLARTKALTPSLMLGILRLRVKVARLNQGRQRMRPGRLRLKQGIGRLNPKDNYNKKQHQVYLLGVIAESCVRDSE